MELNKEEIKIIYGCLGMRKDRIDKYLNGLSDEDKKILPIKDLEKENEEIELLIKKIMKKC